MRLQIEGLLREKEQWHHEQMETRTDHRPLQWDKEELSDHNRWRLVNFAKKVSVLKGEL